MKAIHVPAINPRYWTAITLASICGTNLGDLYAHTAQLGIVQGLLILCVLAAVVFALEYRDHATQEIHYWLLILIIRTGATNIADYLAFRLHIPMPLLIAALAAGLATLAWQATTAAGTGLPATNARYWLAMLLAGVFGTVTGDAMSHLIGQGLAAIVLSVLLGAALWLRSRGAAASAIGWYWLTVACARTAGTALGDWLAENHTFNLGLPLCTALTLLTFMLALLLLPRGSKLRLGATPG